ncbi:SDR family NAD(P)-dependent oxidoreductase [Achromobacter xylosoxidans]|uniref:SDR family NAD(P)-dependent oxidoreductase n=1 Tax=Alcaligenes xylosoxydans xylosoxydans TaxID=85698 RepID=UPI0013F4C810|nr:SDR family oxidoreductase [Achromobacter xylosoxidans]MDX3880721.1 SDR family oxidoreductase [Achromobacter sp.]
MDFALRGKCAWVVGASGAIGGSVSMTLAQLGVSVWLSGRNEGKLQALQETLLKAGHAAKVVPLKEAADFPRAVAAMVAAQQTPDLLVNSTASPRFDSFDRLSDEHWDEVFEAKLLTYVRSMRAALPVMAGRGGAIINISGRGGRQPSATHLAGGSMNAAVNLLTKGISEAYREQGVRANVVSPGPISSPRMGTLEASTVPTTEPSVLARPGQTQDVANAVAFLASPLAAHINGVILGVDGGGISAI